MTDPRPAEILVRRTMQVYEPLYIAISKAAISKKTTMYEFMNRLLLLSIVAYNKDQKDPDLKVKFSTSDQSALNKLLNQMNPAA